MAWVTLSWTISGTEYYPRRYMPDSAREFDGFTVIPGLNRLARECGYTKQISWLEAMVIFVGCECKMKREDIERFVQPGTVTMATLRVRSQYTVSMVNVARSSSSMLACGVTFSSRLLASTSSIRSKKVSRLVRGMTSSRMLLPPRSNPLPNTTPSGDGE